MRVANNELVVIDVETTGVNPACHELLSVALVPMAEQVEPFVIHVKQKEPVWTEFAKKNFERFEDEWNRKAIPPRDAYQRMTAFIREVVSAEAPVTLVGHNVGFDLAFLRKLVSQAGFKDITWASHRTLDTYSLLYVLNLLGEIPDDAMTSDGGFSFFGIEIAGDRRHTALGDAVATRSLFLKIQERLKAIGDPLRMVSSQSAAGKSNQ